MNTPIDFSALVTAINQRLTNAPALAGMVKVVNEDVKDIETDIQKTLGSLGLMILIGQPTLTQIAGDNPESDPANAIIEFQIAFAENVVVNRKPGKQFLTCLNATVIAYQLLHGWQGPSGWKQFAVDGAQPVRDKTKQLYSLRLRTEKVLPPL